MLFLHCGHFGTAFLLFFSNDATGKIQEHFEKTPRMSTNQLALVISDLQDIEPTKVEVNEMDGRKLRVKVWGRKEFMESLVNVPDKVATIVNYLQDYFNSSLGLPKLDLMAIPMYTVSKASDNWGLMFFKYINYLISSQYSAYAHILYVLHTSITLSVTSYIYIYVTFCF